MKTNMAKFHTIRKSAFGQWAKTEEPAALEHYIWTCMLYGPPEGLVWEMMEAACGNEKLRTHSVKRVVHLLQKEYDENGCNVIHISNVQHLRK